MQAAGAHGSGVGGQGGQHGWITPHLQGRVCTCPPARSYMQAAHGGRHSHGACHGPRAPGRDEALASRHGTPTVSALRCIVQGHSLFLICCAALRRGTFCCCRCGSALEHRRWAHWLHCIAQGLFVDGDAERPWSMGSGHMLCCVTLPIG